MPVFISMLRGVNVGGHNVIKMDALRELYASLKFEEPKTFIQSGNVIFRTGTADEGALAKKIQASIEKEFDIRPEVFLRSAADLRKIIAANPFAKRKDVEPNKLHVSFLAEKPSSDVQKKLLAIEGIPEELHLVGRDLFIYFPDGAGRSKLIPVLDRILKTSATARNWNSVNKMLALAAALEG